MQPSQAAWGRGEGEGGDGRPHSALNPAPQNSFRPDGSKNLSSLRPPLHPGDAVPAGPGLRRGREPDTHT